MVTFLLTVDLPSIGGDQNDARHGRKRQHQIFKSAEKALLLFSPSMHLRHLKLFSGYSLYQSLRHLVSFWIKIQPPGLIINRLTFTLTTLRSTEYSMISIWNTDYFT